MLSKSFQKISQKTVFRSFSTSSEYAFEMASSSVRFGRGVSKEVGEDFRSLGLTRNICLVTDKTLVNLPPVKKVCDSLRASGIDFEIFDDVQVSSYFLV